MQKMWLHCVTVDAVELICIPHKFYGGARLEVRVRVPAGVTALLFFSVT